MPDAYRPPPRSWLQKFQESFRGLYIAIRSESSFAVHLFFAALVVITAAVLRVTATEWCLLVLCIATVITAEVLNSGLETLAKAMRHDYDPLIRDALDISSGAVMAMAIGAMMVGVVIFVPHLLQLLE